MEPREHFEAAIGVEDAAGFLLAYYRMHTQLITGAAATPLRIRPASNLVLLFVLYNYLMPVRLLLWTTYGTKGRILTSPTHQHTSIATKRIS